MERYFSDEENVFIDCPLPYMHRSVLEMSESVASNLFFKQAYRESGERVHKVKLARSCYSLIMVCEAIIEKYARDERGEALDDMRRYKQRREDECEQENAGINELVKKILGLS